MESLEQIKSRISEAVREAQVDVIDNINPGGQASLLVNAAQALAVATFLRDDSVLRLDYVSNVTGIDWLDKVVEERVRRRLLVDGVEREVEEVTQRVQPGFIEVVYHVYSMSLKQGPVILRQRTGDRLTRDRVASLTPVWRGAEFQEREIFDLYGVHFEGHPDLRRLLMWEGFQDHPMRKDYAEPDDYEYEPTPHDAVLEKARRHYSQEVQP